MKFINNLNEVYKFWSVQLLALATVLQTIFLEWDTYSEYVPEQYHNAVMIVLMIGSAIARTMKQNNLTNNLEK